jgi:hypothetical protein
MLSDRIKDLPHSGRTLQDHLDGTANILRYWNCSDDIVNAGLYHSVYGTSSYKNVATTNREEVVALIGVHAESLVYTFCNTNYNRMLHFIHNRNTELILVECANLMEQKSRNFEILERAVDFVPEYIGEHIGFYIMDNH